MTTFATAQKLATEQGKLFEDSCELALRCAGFRIEDTHKVVQQIGVEIDIVVTNQNDIAFYFTCKGSMRGPRPGVRRTDTLKKAICDSFLLSQAGWTPVVLLTSHIPYKGCGRAMLHSIKRTVLYDVLNPWMHCNRLSQLATATQDAIQFMENDPLLPFVDKNWTAIPTPASKVVHPQKSQMYLPLN